MTAENHFIKNFEIQLHQSEKYQNYSLTDIVATDNCCEWSKFY